jgi:Cu-Zn family superoxide dismutase
MRHVGLIVSVLLVSALFAAREGRAETVKAELRNAQGEKIGDAMLIQEGKGVKIALSASKLPPGKHGFHIHAVGKCEPPDFKSAVGHFNPEGKKHGLNNPEGPHAGDLQNVTVKEDGTVKTEIMATRVTLGPGKDSLFQSEGTALVLHADPDDEKSDPAGNAGARIACGVITKE